MVYSIRNEKVSANIESRGASLVGFSKRNGPEFLCEDASAYSIFPVCGKLYAKKFLYDGEFYSMHDDGFIKDCEFSLYEQTKERLVLKLKSDEKSLAVYPFKFELTVTYTLEESSLCVSYCALNLGTKKLIFSLGSAFDMKFNGDMSNNCVIFEEPDVRELGINKDGYFTDKTKLISKHGGKLPCKSLDFGRAYMFFGKCKKIGIPSENSGITVSFKDFGYLELRRLKRGNDSLLRICPMTGIPSTDGKTDNIRYKREMNSSSANEKSIFTYTVKPFT